MKKWILSLVLAVCLLASLGLTAYAADLGGTVTFDGKTLASEFTTADANAAAGALQPGDDITFTITLKNNHNETTDWWMKNSIIDSFEDSGKASAGAYTYRLTYTGPTGTNTFYDSVTVGGDADKNTGLKEVSGTLKNYFYLGQLKANETATVTLYIALDGETQGNDYQSQLANLDMRFAVEIVSDNSNVVKTGDDTNIVPYLLASSVSGVILLAVAILRVRSAGRKRQGGHAK